MHRNEELHKFLLDKSWQLTEDWYASLDKSDPAGVYSSMDPVVIENLKQQNYRFHLQLCEIFIKDEKQFTIDIQAWILEIVKDEPHFQTPNHFTLREFFRVQDQYLDFLQEFVTIHGEKYDRETIDLWNRMIIKAFKLVILRFVKELNHYTESRLLAQQELINQLSSPVIAIDNNAALLPLVGEIDTNRSRFILEKTLLQCSSKGITVLFIDLSGVLMIDTMVAQQLIQLFDALDLIGVKTVLSGLRPEIAQTSVQLGLSFHKVKIVSTLAQALANR
jgi:rsbT co-antagonist protein RsbR